MIQSDSISDKRLLNIYQIQRANLNKNKVREILNMSSSRITRNLSSNDISARLNINLEESKNDEND